jgi:hypothetical protein
LYRHAKMTTIPTQNSPTSVYHDLIRSVGDTLTDEVLKLISNECLSLLTTVRQVETKCLQSYNDATAAAAVLAAGNTQTQPPISSMQSPQPPPM